MKRPTLTLCIGVLLLLPAIVLLANIVAFAFVGSGFLPEQTPDMAAARGLTIWLSGSIGGFITFIGALETKGQV